MAFHEPHTFRRASLGILLLLSSAIGACAKDQAPSDSAPLAKASLCPSCKVLAGGETSDFGASTVAPCGAVYERVTVSKAQAEAMGFDVSGAKKLIEREVDMPMTWKARATEDGKPATGYDEHQTRVHAKLAVDSYTHMRRAAKYCNGATCTYEGVTGECPFELLFLNFKVELETLDGAVQASGNGEAGLWSEPGRDELVGDVYADLSTATGSLRMYPDVPEPRVGVLQIEFLFMPSATHGSIWPKVLPDLRDASGSDAGDQAASDFLVAGYEPLEGTWPCHEQRAASDSVYCTDATPAVGMPSP